MIERKKYREKGQIKHVRSEREEKGILIRREMGVQSPMSVEMGSVLVLLLVYLNG